MSQGLLTIGQVATFRKDGSVEFAAHDASIQPGRHSFANNDEFNTYLGEVLGGHPVGRGVRGTMSRKGTYLRVASDGSLPVTFGDPVLDAISSSAGELVIGDKTIDLRERGNASK